MKYNCKYENLILSFLSTIYLRQIFRAFAILEHLKKTLPCNHHKMRRWGLITPVNCLLVKISRPHTSSPSRQPVKTFSPIFTLTNFCNVLEDRNRSKFARAITDQFLICYKKFGFRKRAYSLFSGPLRCDIPNLWFKTQKDARRHLVTRDLVRTWGLAAGSGFVHFWTIISNVSAIQIGRAIFATLLITVTH